MKKILFQIISLLAVFSLFVSCDELMGGGKDDPPPVAYPEACVLFEGSQEINNWWASDDVILKIDKFDEQFPDDVNALQISYITKGNTTPQFIIEDTKNWKDGIIETVRGDGYLYGDYRVDLISNKKKGGVVVCKISKDFMNIIAQNGLLIFGNELTITKVTLVNDDSTEPGNIHEDPLQIPRELENDIVVWEGSKEVLKSETFKFTNVTEKSTDANALRITYSTGKPELALFVEMSPTKVEYSMGQGYVKSYFDGSSIIVLESNANDATILLKIADDDFGIDYLIRNGLGIYNPYGNSLTISKIVLTKLEETTIWEGEKVIDWGENALTIEEPKIPEDAKSIIVNYIKTSADKTLINFNNGWWDGQRPYCASGNYAVIPGYKNNNGEEDETPFPLVDQSLVEDPVNGLTSFVFTKDQFKEFHEKGLVINGQEITIKKVQYMKFSETGPTVKSE